MSFIIQEVYFDGKHLPLVFNKPISEENHFTIIVGKNSIGKSRLLSSIVGAFEAIDGNGRIQKVRSGLGYGADRILDNFSLLYEKGGRSGQLIVNSGRCEYADDFDFGEDEIKLQTLELNPDDMETAKEYEYFLNLY